MFQSAMNWLGFGYGEFAHKSGHGHSHGDGEGHGHTHGVMDATIATTERGIWAIKWSFVLLMTTTILQSIIVYYSASVALLADTIHNFGDASTAIPLWVAFRLARRKPSLRFTHGLGRVEDIAGVIIVGLILFSAIVAGWQAVERLLNPEPISYLGWVLAAGVIGFIGNEAVAVFRIRVGREIDSAALIADGYHARVDGFTSLAVVAGAVGVWLGFPLADPIVGLLITVMIFGIVWQSARSVFTRMLDGTEPEIPGEVGHAAEHVAGVRGVGDVRARWMGHRLAVELDMVVDPETTVQQADAIAAKLENELRAHLPALSRALIRPRPFGAATLSLASSEGLRPAVAGQGGHGHGHDHPHPHPHGDDHEKNHDHPHPHRHDHDHPHPHEDGHKDHDHPHPHPHDGGHGKAHGHSHDQDHKKGHRHDHGDHDHPHPHEHDHGHDHGHDDHKHHDHPHPHDHQPKGGHGHHHAPEPIFVRGRLGAGELEIVETPAGERFRFTPAAAASFEEASVAIDRGAGTQELLPLRKLAGGEYESDRAPAEPHEFAAKLTLRRGSETEALPFKMAEPEGHHGHHGHGGHPHPH